MGMFVCVCVCIVLQYIVCQPICSIHLFYWARITCTYVKIGLACETTVTYVHALITCQCGTDVLIVGTMEQPYYLVLIVARGVIIQ